MGDPLELVAGTADNRMTVAVAGRRRQDAQAGHRPIEHRIGR